jgi:hypothetical protein
MSWDELLEMHHTVRKSEVQRNASSVCVHPDSIFYGQRRRKNNVGCECFHDYFWRWDNDGEKPSEQQAAFVSMYRRDVHGLDPLPGHSAGGWNPC